MYFLIGLILVAIIGYLAGMWDAHGYYMQEEDD